MNSENAPPIQQPKPPPPPPPPPLIILLWLSLSVVMPAAAQALPLSDVHEELRAMRSQQALILKENAVLSQKVLDLEKTLDMNGAAIAKLDTSPMVDRIFRIESFVANQEKAAVEQQKDSDRHWQDGKSFGLALFGVLASMMLSNMWSAWKARRNMHGLTTTVVELVKHTNGLLAKSNLDSKTLGHEAGLAEGIEQERRRV